jgi:hypothetical protein
MPSARKDTTPVAFEHPQVEFRNADLGDGYTVGFEHFKSDSDPTDLFQGLPDDRCQCPHWGYVLAGKITFRFADHDEVYEAGDAFYAPPGHLPLPTGGTSIVEFSPAAEKAKTDEVIGRNMAAGAEAR